MRVVISAPVCPIPIGTSRVPQARPSWACLLALHHHWLSLLSAHSGLTRLLALHHYRLSLLSARSSWTRVLEQCRCWIPHM